MKKVKVRYNKRMSGQNYQVFFNEAMNQIHEEYKNSGNEDYFKIWFQPISYIEDTLSEITVSVASNFMQRELDSRGITSAVEKKLLDLTGQSIKLKYIIVPPNQNQSSIVEEKPQQTVSNTVIVNEAPKPVNAPVNHHPQLREDYTFDHFVPGENSIYAFNAAQAAAKNPGKAYNPILIYGGVGLGKTHLMQAIGNYIYAEKGDSCKICYVSTEDFGNEFYTSIKKNETDKFKNKYRRFDVLLLDDIHFLKDKEKTQEELFYTFNALYDRNCQMVFTCDRPITELKFVEERLRTRFSRGLNIDLQPPDYETRRAILEKKKEILLEKKQFSESIINRISADVIDYIAKNVQTNVRDLEGCLTKLIGYAELVGKNLTIEIAQQQLRDTFSSPLSGTITVETIQKVVASHYNISISDIRSQKRSTKFVIPRQIAIYISRKLTEFSYPELGGEFGGRNHATMIHSIEKIENAIKVDSNLDTTIQHLIREIKDYKK